MGRGKLSLKMCNKSGKFSTKNSLIDVENYIKKVMFSGQTTYGLMNQIGRVNCPVPNRAEIRTANFQVQYLLQFYP